MSLYAPSKSLIMKIRIQKCRHMVKMSDTIVIILHLHPHSNYDIIHKLLHLIFHSMRTQTIPSPWEPLRGMHTLGTHRLRAQTAISEAPKCCAPTTSTWWRFSKNRSRWWRIYRNLWTAPIQPQCFGSAQRSTRLSLCGWERRHSSAPVAR